MKIKTKLYAFLIIFIFCGFPLNRAHAQKTDSPPPPPKPPVASENKRVDFSKAADYIFNLQIDSNSNITLSVQETESSESIGSLANTTALIDFISLLRNSGSKNSNGKTSKVKINPIIIVKANPNLTFGSTVDFLTKIRKLSDLQIKLETSKNFDDSFVFIPKEPKNDPSAKLKPNPLTLIVQVKPDKKITLNNMDEGTLEDSSGLKKKLIEIFREREANGAFREGTNEVEKTVFVKASRSLQLYDVVKIVDALKEAGASPVGLQIDDLQL